MLNTEVDAKVLTSLIIMQMMLRQLSKGGDVSGFICHGLLDVPGVASVKHEAEAKGEPSGVLRRIPVRMGDHSYGDLVIEVSDREAFYPYEPYVGNLAFIMAAVLDEERGKKAAEDRKRELEKMIDQRTAELKKAQYDALSAQKLAEDYLRVSEAMIIELDADARVVVANDRACALLGYERGELIGQNWIELVIPQDSREDVEKVFRGVIAGEESVEYYDNLVTRKDGECLSVAWHNVTLYDESGKVKGTLSSGIDITDRLKLEELSQRAERLESMGILAGGVAHDLNNLLGPLVGLPEMIIQDVESCDCLPDQEKSDILESIELIDACAKKATGVVRDLLAMGRRRRYELQPLDLRSCVRDCVEQQLGDDLVSAERSVSIETELPEEPLIILGEGSSLRRVIGNLLRNAVEAITEKGVVKVSCAAKDLKEHRGAPEAIPPGRYAVLSVGDTGSGIAPQHISRIFEPFFSQKAANERSGSGLGLSVVYGIVKDHGGHIDLHSEEGRGTTFYVYLPLEEGGVAATQLESPDPAAGKGRVLVVDDEKSQRYIARKFLVKAGYTVTESISGTAALALFKAAHDEGKPQPYDAVVLDMMMEDGFDGLEAMKAIRELYPEIAVLIASGHAPSDRSAEAVHLGAKWLQKPYSMKALLSEISEVMQL